MLFCAWMLGFLLRASTVLAMTFTPTVTDFPVMQGETLQADFTVQNTASTTKEYLVSLYDVTLSSSLESPSFAPLPQERSAWLSLDTYGFSLASGASRALLLTAAPPADAASESFVVGLVVRELAEDNGIAVSSGVTSLMFVTVGNPTSDAVVTQWSVSPRVMSRLDLEVTAEFTNDGERVVQPYGFVQIANTFGRVVEEIQINPTLSRVPVDDVRVFTATVAVEKRGGFFYELWREIVEHRIGVFTAKLVAAPYPGADATLLATTRFFVVPWRLLLVALFGGGLVRAIVRRGRAA